MAELKERINGAWVSRGQVSPQNIGRQLVPAILEDVTITPSESQQTRTAGQGYGAIRQVVVNAIPNDYVGSGVTRKAAATYTPTESAQSIEANQYLTGAQTINAIPGNYVGSSVPREQGKTITPSNVQQIAVTAGTYAEGNILVAAAVQPEPEPPELQDKTVTPTESAQDVTADAGYDGLGTVHVNAISSTYIGSDVTRKAAASYTPSESTQTIAAGQYLDGAQTINAISSTYVGSGITRRSSTDLTVSGATVSVPAGYYSSAASKSIPVYDGSVS